MVGRILGRQFAGDNAIRQELEHCAMPQLSAVIVGLSIAWKDSPTLATEINELRASRGQGTSRYVWPDVIYLVSTLGSRDEFCQYLGHLLETATGYLWDFLPFCLEPIVERIKSEGGVASTLIQRLAATRSGNDKASLPKLLALANNMNEELRQWCEKEFAAQSNHTSLPEFGLDISAGDIRPVAHAILDALSPNQ